MTPAIAPDAAAGAALAAGCPGHAAAVTPTGSSIIATMKPALSALLAAFPVALLVRPA